MSSRVRVIALCDYLTRVFYKIAHQMGADVKAAGGWHDSKGGDIKIDAPVQQILERSSFAIRNKFLEVRFTISLPAQGRTILGQWASQILVDTLPEIVINSMFYNKLNSVELQEHIFCFEDQEYLRSQLKQANLCAFVLNGAVLPRQNGASDLPLKGSRVVSFQSPHDMLCSFVVPNRGKVIGMGIPIGVTLIIGGGFHGKSTLLRALEMGVYSHVPGDGREFVVCDRSAVKIRAEDGRPTSNVDISGFIGTLPYGQRTDSFSTGDASGSTSMAANIVEALEVGSTTLLIDEDTSATNFLIRDELMAKLVPAEKEPIIPLVTQVRSLFSDFGVSTIIVIGGCGDYVPVSDTVIAMDSYIPCNLTARAHQVANEFKPSLLTSLAPQTTEPTTSPTPRPTLPQAIKFKGFTPRCVLPGGLFTAGKTHPLGLRKIAWHDQTIDLQCTSQLIDESQTHAITLLMCCLAHKLLHPPSQSQSQSQPQSSSSSSGITQQTPLPLRQALESLEEQMNKQGLDSIALYEFNKEGVETSGHFNPIGDLARPRVFELTCAINRLRTLSTIPVKSKI
ncbi:ABC transport system ATP-binding protein [Pelomyxa schiedti]|nr:ABC transport system ATP-binding protein [Pelomyxa schiedti]